MKKLFVLFAVLLAALFVVGCASKPPAGPTAAELMAEAKSGAPMGALVGQATAQGSKDNSAVNKAEQNAMGQIKKGLVSIVAEMLTAQVQEGRLQSATAEEFRTSVNGLLQMASLTGIQRVDSGNDAAFKSWAIVALSKAEALKEITSAVNAAKRDVSGSSNFSLDGFDAAFAKAADKEWK